VGPGHNRGKARTNPDALPGESRKERLERARAGEAEADHFALEVMKNMHALPTGAALVSTWHFLIFQRSNLDSGSDHPLDSDRVKKVVEFAKENIHEFDLGQHSYEEVLAVLENGAKLAEQVESGEVSFSDLDQQARSVTLDSLRRFRAR
jgi:hypothetical protein